MTSIIYVAGVKNRAVTPGTIPEFAS